MKTTFLLFPILFIGLLLPACQPTDTLTYEVKKIDRRIQLDGKGDDPLWETAQLLTDFTYPWRDEAPPATSFRALWDGSHFFFLYRAEDPEIITPDNASAEQGAVNSDRVEIFFKTDDRMAPYYALEMDALGRKYDSRSVYHRNIDPEWDWPEEDITLKTSIDENGYWLEGAISLASLRALDLYQDDGLLKAGLYRGDYSEAEDGTMDIGWISWVIPDSETPDFHIPSSFGLLKLEP